MTDAALAVPEAASVDWDYRTADTKQLTHGIHPYPAMMIPQVAQRLVGTYGDEGTLFDPYCGSGTTLLEGMLAGMSAVGTDLNPLARLIARVKTTPVCTDTLDRAIARFSNGWSLAEAPIPDVPNVNYWFSADMQSELAAIRQHIERLRNERVANVFRIAFSLAVRKASWTRTGEFKLHRIPLYQMDRHNPDPFDEMLQALTNIRQSLQALNHAAPARIRTPAVHSFNTVNGVPSGLGPVSLVVTSPPYGDSRTTVAYGQFSRLSSQWLGFECANRVDNLLMGGSKVDRPARFGFGQLDNVIASIARLDDRRACDVASFFADYQASIRHVAASIARGGYACYVVGNRTVKGHKVPTAETTAAFFEQNGFRTEAVNTRNIPNKRMPSMNSPSNIPGEVSETMTTEQIVVCRKV